MRELTRTNHLYNFEDLSSDDFSRLCFWIVDTLDEFSDAQHYDLTGDKNRDVIANRYNKNRRTIDVCYFQCKRYKNIRIGDLKRELDGINHHSHEDSTFKPDRIYFVLSCDLSPTIKDQIKIYGKELGFHTILFWTRTELDKKVKDTNASQEFFSPSASQVEIKEYFGKESDSIKNEIRNLAKTFTGNEPLHKEQKQLVDLELNKAKKLIDDNQFKQAIEKVTAYLGILNQNPDKYKKQLSIAYHYLAICFNRLPDEGGDIDKAEDYAKAAIKLNPRKIQFKCTLAYINIRKGKKENFEKAYKITSRIWDNSKKKEPYFLDIYLWAVALLKSSEEAIRFFELSDEAQQIVSKNEVTSTIIGTFYAELKNYKRSLEFIENALRINPNSPRSLYLKAVVNIAQTLSEENTPSNFEIVPKLKDYSKIEESLEILSSARSFFKEKPDLFYEQLTKLEIFYCALILNKPTDKKHLSIRNEIIESLLPDYEKKKLKFLDFVNNFNSRMFSNAIENLTQFPDWADMDYATKIKFAQIFLRHGAPEQSKQILSSIESVAIKEKNVRFWVEMSFIEALLGNKTRFLNAINKIKQVSIGTRFEEAAFLHQISLTQRYNAEETDRFVENLFEHDNKFPNQRLGRPIKVLDDNKKPTQEILDLFAKKRESYEKFKEYYNKNYVPIYLLEEYSRLPYAKIVATMDDPTLQTKLYAPISSFDQEIRENFDDAKDLIFDYSSLLNLSKMGMLEELERLDKILIITLSLFNKIQYELILFENEDLRRLWNFLRESNSIHIIDFDNQKLKSDQISKLLEKWIVDLFELSSEKNAIVMTDDLSFFRLLKEYKIKGCISLCLVRWLFENEFIDEKIYGCAIGDLAERFYIVIPFDSVDLYYTILEDDCKIRLRSYHLINHITISGIIRSVYSNEYRGLMNKLWKLSILPEDKNNWLQLITTKMLEALDLCNKSNNRLDAFLITLDLKGLWYDIINASSHDDFAIIKEDYPKLFVGEHFEKIKEYIETLITAKE